MTRDMDIVRQIALAAADLPYGQGLDRIEGIDRTVFAMHVIWMKEGGLVAASVTEYTSGDAPRAEVIRLTWDGCEFADAVRSDTVWRKAKESVVKPTTSFTFGLLKEWLAAEIRDGFPTLRR